MGSENNDFADLHMTEDEFTDAGFAIGSVVKYFICAFITADLQLLLFDLNKLNWGLFAMFVDKWIVMLSASIKKNLHKLLTSYWLSTKFQKRPY